MGGAEFIDYDPSVALSPPAPPPTPVVVMEPVDSRFLDAIVVFLVASGFTVTAPYQLTVPAE